MKLLNSSFVFCLYLLLVASCSSAQKIEEKSPIQYGNVYFQNWMSGIKGGGSGLNLFIPITSSITQNIDLDSVYFRGKVTKLELIEQDELVYVGRFKLSSNQPKNILMSNDSNEEFGNEISLLSVKFPFELKESECVVSYFDGDIKKYFKIVNIIEKSGVNYPSVRKE